MAGRYDDGLGISTPAEVVVIRPGSPFHRCAGPVLSSDRSGKVLAYVGCNRPVAVWLNPGEWQSYHR
jgi:hypothetical protein